MSQYATKDEVQGIVNKAVEDLSEIIGTFVEQVDNRFNKIEEDMRATQRSIDRLTNTIDGFVARIDAYETEQTARDSQFEKLLVWARKVSKKTGIPLENL